MMERSTQMMWIGGLMLVVGAVLPFLMVIMVVPKSLLLSLVAYVCSVGGLFVGLIGLAGVRSRAVDRERRAEDGTGEMFDFR